MEQTELTLTEWKQIAVQRFGRRINDWHFVCPLCGHVQSVATIRAHHPEWDERWIARWVARECEGLHENPIEHGCNAASLFPDNVRWPVVLLDDDRTKEVGHAMPFAEKLKVRL